MVLPAFFKKIFLNIFLHFFFFRRKFFFLQTSFSHRLTPEILLFLPPNIFFACIIYISVYMTEAAYMLVAMSVIGNHSIAISW